MTIFLRYFVSVESSPGKDDSCYYWQVIEYKVILSVELAPSPLTYCISGQWREPCSFVVSQHIAALWPNTGSISHGSIQVGLHKPKLNKKTIERIMITINII